MDNFKAVYKILSALEKAMDYPEFDINDGHYILFSSLNFPLISIGKSNGLSRI